MTLPPYPGSDDNPDEGPEKDPNRAPDTGPPLPPYGQSDPTPYGQQPYGPPGQPPYGQAPYGQVPYGQAPYGQQPYGAWQGGNDPATSYNGFSIAAFVLSLTCCLGIPAAVCGVIGLHQTRRDGSKGRWMAVTGIVLGVLGTLVAAAVIAFIAWFAGNVVTAENAERGMCVNTDEDDSDSVALMQEDCSSEHDAQIYAIHVLQASEVATELDPVRICTEELGVDAARAMNDGLSVYSVTEHDDPEAGDRIVCLLENADGEKLSEELDY